MLLLLPLLLLLPPPLLISPQFMPATSRWQAGLPISHRPWNWRPAVAIHQRSYLFPLHRANLPDFVYPKGRPEVPKKKRVSFGLSRPGSPRMPIFLSSVPQSRRQRFDFFQPWLNFDPVSRLSAAIE